MIFNFIKRYIKTVDEQDYYYSVYVDASKIKNNKFSRPDRRSNECSDNGFEISSRLINSTERS